MNHFLSNTLIRLAAVDQIVPSKPKHPGFKVTKPLLILPGYARV